MQITYCFQYVTIMIDYYLFAIHKSSILKFFPIPNIIGNQFVCEFKNRRKDLCSCNLFTIDLEVPLRQSISDFLFTQI